LSFRIFAFYDNLKDLLQLFDYETGTERCVARVDSDANVSLFYSNQVVCAIPDHSYLETALSSEFLPKGKSFTLPCDPFFVHSDNQCLVLGRNAGEYFDFIMQEAFRIGFDEIVVHRIKVISVCLKGEIRYFFCYFFDLSACVLEKM
jgi:hypothetical protein